MVHSFSQSLCHVEHRLLPENWHNNGAHFTNRAKLVIISTQVFINITPIDF